MFLKILSIIVNILFFSPVLVSAPIQEYLILEGPKGFWKNNTPIYYQDFISSEESRIKYWEQSINFKSNFGSFFPMKDIKQLVKLSNQKKQGHCITQNVDNLHQDGGLSSDDVTEIHGNATFAVCLIVKQRIDLKFNP